MLTLAAQYVQRGSLSSPLPTKAAFSQVERRKKQKESKSVWFETVVLWEASADVQRLWLHLKCWIAAS